MVQAAIGIPLLHLGDVTAQAVTRAGVTTVGFLATAITMEQDCYRDRLTGHGLRVLIPAPDDRAEVRRIIYDELCLGVVREESGQAYRAAIVRLVRAGAEGVVLGCTEIELLVSETDRRSRSSPPPALHVEAAVDASFGHTAGASDTSQSDALRSALGTSEFSLDSSPDPLGDESVVVGGAVAQLLQHVLRESDRDRGAEPGSTSHGGSLGLLVGRGGVEGVLLLRCQVGRGVGHRSSR